MNTEVMREWEFWENLDAFDRDLNTEGVPPYNAEEVAYMVMGMLENRRIRVERVLDLGCGTGRLTYAIASRRGTWELHGLDISKAMLSRVARNWTTNMRTHLGDGRTLPEGIKGWGLHGAYSVAMFQHIPIEAQRKYVLQVAERLFAGCRFVFTVALGGGEKFLEHRVDWGIVNGWCADAGLGLVDFIQADSRGWAWFVTEKPW